MFNRQQFKELCQEFDRIHKYYPEHRLEGKEIYEFFLDKYDLRDFVNYEEELGDI